jgi:hypothetical protein
MDTVDVNGVSYEKASLLAKEFKYTSDYIGQLCRAKKVEAQLIGRTWYVNRSSLENHRATKYGKNKNPLDEKTFEYSVKINKSRIDVEPFLKRNVAKMIDSKSKNFQKRMDWNPVKYESDQSELLPTISIQPRKINVDLADAKKIRIDKKSVETRMESEDLPSVALSGDLRVSSLDYSYETDDEVLDKEPKDFLNDKNKIGKQDLNKEPVSVTDNNDFKIDLIPTSVKNIKIVENELRIKKWTALAVIFLLSGLLTLSLFVELRVDATINSYDTGFHFSLNLSDLFFVKK